MKEYSIRDSEGLSAVILPEKGATVVSLQKEGVEFLYRWEENLDSPERPRCGIPFLFPTFGRMENGHYLWEGNTYPMAIHGFAHTCSWNVIRHEENELVLELTDTEELRTMYPFWFCCELTFRLENGGLSIWQRYENLDKMPMPYAFGFHPYFALEKLENVSVEATAHSRFDFAAGKMLPFGHGAVTLAEPESFPEVGSALLGLQSPVVLDIIPEGRRITMSFTEDFPQLVLWHPKNAPFLCVEPINGSANGFNTGNYLTLQPGETKIVSLNIQPEIV